MTYYQLRARDCYRIAVVLLLVSASFIGSAFLVPNPWLALGLVIFGVRALFRAHAEVRNYRHYLSRIRNR